MIEMENITKGFRLGESVVTILKGINLYIGRGEFVSIMGPSGSGKSTLSSLLGCLAKPTSGSYKINGQEISSLSPALLAQLRNRKIGFIFQDFNLLEGMSAWQNVALPLFYAGVSTAERKRRAMECLKLVGLESKVNHLSSQLSGGQKQRVAIARALVNEPDFLFADEPTGALDTRTGQEIMGIMQHLNLMGHTIVQVTHSPSDARFAKRILHIVDGLIVKDELVERPTVAHLLDSAKHSDEIYTRLWRVAQLSKDSDPKTFDCLKSLYDFSKIRSNPREIVKTFIRWQTQDSDTILQELFHHDDWAIRAEVIKVCGLRGISFALPFYLEAMRDKNAWVRFLSLSELKRQGRISLTDAQKQLLLGAFNDADERVRSSVASLFGQWKDPVAPLKKAINDTDGRVRANALEAAALFLSKEDPNLLEEIKTHLEDKNNRARANAAVLLFPFLPEEALSTLSKMLVSENNLMRSSAAWALGQIPTARGGPWLLEQLKHEKEEMVVEPIIRSLGKLSQNGFSLQEQIELILNMNALGSEHRENVLKNQA